MEEKSCAPTPCPSFENVTITVTATSELDQTAARAYAAYAKTFEGNLFLGQAIPMMPYAELNETAKVGWRAAVRQVMDDLGVDAAR